MKHGSTSGTPIRGIERMIQTEYEFKTGKDTASLTGRVDPRDILVEDDEQEDLAWALAGAYAFLKEEQDEE